MLALHRSGSWVSFSCIHMTKPIYVDIYYTFIPRRSGCWKPNAFTLYAVPKCYNASTVNPRENAWCVGQTRSAVSSSGVFSEMMGVIQFTTILRSRSGWGAFWPRSFFNALCPSPSTAVRTFVDVALCIRSPAKIIYFTRTTKRWKARTNTCPMYGRIVQIRYLWSPPVQNEHTVEKRPC